MLSNYREPRKERDFGVKTIIPLVLNPRCKYVSNAFMRNSEELKGKVPLHP